MLSFLQYLIAFVISRYDGGPTGDVDTAGIAFVLLAFWLATTLYGRRLEALARTRSSDAVAAFLASGNLIRIAALGCFWLVAQPVGGRGLPEALGLERTVLLPDLARLAPYLALVVIARSALHPAARILRLGPPDFSDAAVHELRQALLPLAPVVLIFVVFDSLALLDRFSAAGSLVQAVASQPVLMILLVLTVVFVALLAMPFVLRLFWRARPLPEGPLRDRLESYSRRVGFRARDILVWPADVLNAAVIGSLPRFRYVVITAALLEALSDDEVEAVFAHEAGHARRGHILLFFGFTAVLPLASLFPALMPAPAAAALAAIPDMVRVVAMLLVWFGVIFGFVSRRFEQEADVYGLETLRLAGSPTPSDPLNHPFVRALERIGREAGGIREITGWRHFSIADRVEFLQAYLTVPDVRARYRRAIRFLRGGMLAVICGFGLAAGVQVPAAVAATANAWGSLRDPAVRAREMVNAALAVRDDRGEQARLLAQAAGVAQRAGRSGDALRWLREAVSRAPGDPDLLARYAALLEQLGRPRGARLAWSDLAASESASDAVRKRAADRARELSESSSRPR